MSSQSSSSSQETIPSGQGDRKWSIKEKFPPFDQQSIVNPFEEEKLRDIEFGKQMTRMLVDILIQCHAWASVRPIHESNLAAAKLENQINDILKVEAEQGRSRPQFLSRLLDVAREGLLHVTSYMHNVLALLQSMTPSGHM